MNISFGLSSIAIQLPQVLLIFFQSGHRRSFIVITSCFSCHNACCNFRHAMRLKYWSFQPISTSAFILTESNHCIIGYRNSCIEILVHDFSLFEKLSRSIISATEKCFANSPTSLNDVLSSHSLLKCNSIRLISRIFDILPSQSSAFFLVWDLVSMGLSDSLSDVSPTCAVESPIIKTMTCHSSWNCLNFNSGTACHRCMIVQVGSIQNLTRNFLLAIFWRRTSSSIIFETPFDSVFMLLSCYWRREWGLNPYSQWRPPQLSRLVPYHSVTSPY